MLSDISVIVATYNGAPWLQVSLESVFAQTAPPAEIIVVDDCSTDETQQVVRSLAANSPVPLRLLVLDKNSGGPSRPLNIGVDAAKSEWIATLDQDDVMRPRRLEVQHSSLIESNECSLSLGRFTIIGSSDEDGLKQMWPVPQFDGLDEAIDNDNAFSVVDSRIAFKPLLERNYAGSTSNFFFSRSNFYSIGKFDETVTTCSDLDFLLRATFVGPIAVVNEILFDYRWNPASLQRKDLTRSSLEATMVRLRAASERPEWAGDELQNLRQSALAVANAAVRKGDFKGIRAIAETLSKHKGLEVVRQTLDHKMKRLVHLNDN